MSACSLRGHRLGSLTYLQNWNRYWKITVITLSTATSFSQGWGPLALAPMFGHLKESFDTDLPSVVKFTGVCILVLGFSNFFW